MLDELFYRFPLWAIFVCLLVIFSLAGALGHQVGHRFCREASGKEPSHFVPTTVLGLLALMLGFTFSMSVSRFEHRQHLVLEEASAISTAFLRADTLPEPYRTQAKENLKKYVPVRMQFFAAGIDQGRLQYVSQETARIQARLWKDAAELSFKDPSAITGLFVSAVNAVMDVSAERAFAMENHVPEVVYMMICLIAAVGMASLGVTMGAGGAGWRGRILTLAVLFALVTVLIQDLDRPRRGLIQVSQKSLSSLLESL